MRRILLTSSQVSFLVTTFVSKLDSPARALLEWSAHNV